MIIPIKVILAGDGAVGKTTLRRKYMGQTTGSRYLPTLGAEISINNFEYEVDGKDYYIKIQIWDIAGQKKFNSVRPLYYKGSQGIFLVYDITNATSFINLEEWIAHIAQYIKLGKIPIILIGNKLDMRSEGIEQISSDQGFELAKKVTETYSDGSWKVPFIETSALRGDNVKESFEEIAKLTVSINKEGKNE
ncbi:MAG: GTPase KRas precursor [Candidatus Heimdallarchaeota archaeon LC_3]|nr:MAG: GTPase KRas precursor [Candidatus Heimdallarchaeota archaeon LC_3]